MARRLAASWYRAARKLWFGLRSSGLDGLHERRLGNAHGVDYHEAIFLPGVVCDGLEVGVVDDPYTAHRRRRCVRVPLVLGAVRVAYSACSPRSRLVASSIFAAGGRSSTSGRTLVRRKWSGQEVPSAASTWCLVLATKSSTAGRSVKCPACGWSVEASPLVTGASSAARARRWASGSGW